MNNTIRVVLADDHVFVRDGIKSLLENEANIEVVGEATDGLEALKMVETTHPDLLILDIRMPNLTGIEVVEKLRSQNNLVKIVMLSMHESEEYVLKSIKAGADGYLLKGSSKEEFLKALHTVSNGGKYFSGDISSILIGQLTHPTAVQETKPAQEDELMITKREKEILKLLLSGKGNKEIAEALDIPIDFLADSLDIDERSRYELEDNVKLIVIKTPAENNSFNDSDAFYITIPICIILTHNQIVTVNSFDNGAIKKFLNTFQNRHPDKRNMMVLKVSRLQAIMWIGWQSLTNFSLPVDYLRSVPIF